MNAEDVEKEFQRIKKVIKSFERIHQMEKTGKVKPL